MTPENSNQISQLRDALNASPSPAIALELIGLLLAEPDGIKEARELCFKLLNDTPKNLLARLYLARSFYLDSYYGFCARELLKIRETFSSPNVERLVELFSDFYSMQEIGQPAGDRKLPPDEQKASDGDFESDEGTTVAELDLDFDFAEVLKELEGSEK